MSGIGLLFPGQGAQYVGMGKDLAEKFSSAKEVFSHGNEILGFDLARICFEGPEQVLTLTENAQPAILLTSLAALEVWRELKPRETVRAAAGLSAGEYSALVAVGSLSFDDAVRLVRRRGELMTASAKENPGTMASIIGLTYAQSLELGKQTGTQVANVNSPTQIVMSGSIEAMAKVKEAAVSMGAKRVIPLNVSGAFHSRLMAKAGSGLADELDRVTICPPEKNVHFFANVSGCAVTDIGRIRSGLAEQVVSSVQWVSCMQGMNSLGVTKYYEVGPGKVLKGLAGRIDTAIQVQSWGTAEDMNHSTHHPVEVNS